MIKKINIIYFIILFTVCLTQLTAQERVITEQELVSLQNIANKKLENIKYRYTETSESRRNVNDSVPYYFNTSIYEFAPPDSSHYIFESKTVDGNKRTETINIGEKQYKRANNEDWKEITLNGGGFGGGFGSVVETKENAEFKYLGKKKIRKQEAKLFEKKTTRDYQLNGKNVKSVISDRFWFSKDGLFLRKELESKIGDKVFLLMITDYEYNPKDLKIEAPIK